MRSALLASLFLVALQAAGAAARAADPFDIRLPCSQAFPSFVVTFRKEYASPEEEQAAYEAFCANLESLRELRASQAAGGRAEYAVTGIMDRAPETLLSAPFIHSESERTRAMRAALRAALQAEEKDGVKSQVVAGMWARMLSTEDGEVTEGSEDAGGVDIPENPPEGQPEGPTEGDGNGDGTEAEPGAGPDSGSEPDGGADETPDPRLPAGPWDFDPNKEKDDPEPHATPFDTELDTHRHFSYNRLGSCGYPDFPAELIPPIPEDTLPESVDLREMGLVTPVRDQGTCGSCYTFSAATVFESLILRNGPIIAKSQDHAAFAGPATVLKLSEEYLANSSLSNSFCNGGNMGSMLEDFYAGYLKTVELRSNYPYTLSLFPEVDGPAGRQPLPPKLPESQWYIPFALLPVDSWECPSAIMTINHLPPVSDKGPYPDGTNRIFTREEAQMLRSYLARGVAVSGGMNAGLCTKQFMAYGGGVVDCPCTEATMNHAVTFVGYGYYRTEPVWVLKNSWGSSWGTYGFFMVPASHARKMVVVEEGGQKGGGAKHGQHHGSAASETSPVSPLASQSPSYTFTDERSTTSNPFCIESMFHVVLPRMFDYRPKKVSSGDGSSTSYVFGRDISEPFDPKAWFDLSGAQYARYFTSPFEGKIRRGYNGLDRIGGGYLIPAGSTGCWVLVGICGFLALVEVIILLRGYICPPPRTVPAPIYLNLAQAKKVKRNKSRQGDFLNADTWQPAVYADNSASAWM